MKCRFINRHDGREYSVRHITTSVAADGSVSGYGTLAVYRVVDFRTDYGMLRPYKEVALNPSFAIPVLEELAEQAFDKNKWTTFIVAFGELIHDDHLAHRMCVEALEQYRRGEIAWEQ